jgi:hypothetical protein
MPNPDPRPTPPARQPAASQGRSRGRRPRPGPPGFTYEVQLLGGEAGRRLAQEQTEAIAAVLAWLAGHLPTPTAAAGSAAVTAIGRPVGQSTATPTGTRPAPPSPAGPAGASTQRGTGGSGGAPTPKPRGSGPSGGPGGLEGGGSWSTDPTAVRVQAVGLVGAGWPVGEVARALGVHPAALRRWVWQAWHGWGTAMDLPQPDSPDPPADRNEGHQEG